MDMNIVSTTEIQRNFKRVLERVKISTEPLVVVRDSNPIAVLLSLDEYKRLVSLEKSNLKKKIEQVLSKMRKRNSKVTNKEIEGVLEEANKRIF